MDGNGETTIDNYFPNKDLELFHCNKHFNKWLFQLPVSPQRFFDFPDLATAVREVDDQSKAGPRHCEGPG